MLHTKTPNYPIGTFRRYDRHPITDWFMYDANALKSCPQIQVSINTDDQVVFYTYIKMNMPIY